MDIMIRKNVQKQTTTGYRQQRQFKNKWKQIIGPNESTISNINSASRLHKQPTSVYTRNRFQFAISYPDRFEILSRPFVTKTEHQERDDSNDKHASESHNGSNSQFDNEINSQKQTEEVHDDNISTVNVTVDISRNNMASKIPGAQTGGGKKLAIIYTCAICETRSMKQFTEKAYKHGVVIVTCPKCQSQHLIADNLGYFSNNDTVNSDKKFDLETALSQKGQSIKKLFDEEKDKDDNDNGVYELTLQDIIGQEKYNELIEKADASK